MALRVSALGCTCIAAVEHFTGEGRTRRGESREQDYGSARAGQKQWKEGNLRILHEVFCTQLDIAKNGTQEAWTERFARMYRNRGYPAVRVSEENVAATGSYHFESELAKDANGFLAAHPRKPRHTEICWMPTSSRGAAFWRVSSRQSSTTSCTRFMSVSRFFAWVWQPRRAGTVAT